MKIVQYCDYYVMKYPMHYEKVQLYRHDYTTVSKDLVWAIAVLTSGTKEPAN